jgi:HD-GYP domain-containing protein (c-di-GMP phosphodiesterase class II)
MIKLSHELDDLQLGKPLPWSVFDGRGRSLMDKGTVIDSPAQLALLAEQAVYRSRGEEKNIPSFLEERDGAPFFAIGEMMGRLNAILHGIADRNPDSTVQQLGDLYGAIQLICEEEADAALAAIHLEREGKYAVRHLIHTALLVELVAYRLGYSADDRYRIICAALTANTGMLDLQERLLKKGPVTREERREINRHCEAGVELLQQAGVQDEMWLEIVLQHHERVDGSGYPRGLRGDEIHEGARLIALADIYHAKISDRLYRSAMSPTYALRQVFLGQGKDTDQALVEMFVKELGVFPPGEFVRLSNGEIAVVTHRAENGGAPRVASITSSRGATYPRPLPRESGNAEWAIKEAAERDESVLLTELLPLWDARA